MAAGNLGDLLEPEDGAVGKPAEIRATATAGGTSGLENGHGRTSGNGAPVLLEDKLNTGLYNLRWGLFVALRGIY